MQTYKYVDNAGYHSWIMDNINGSPFAKMCLQVADAVFDGVGDRKDFDDINVLTFMSEMATKCGLSISVSQAAIISGAVGQFHYAGKQWRSKWSDSVSK